MNRADEEALFPFNPYPSEVAQILGENQKNPLWDEAVTVVEKNNKLKYMCDTFKDKHDALFYRFFFRDEKITE